MSTFNLKEKHSKVWEGIFQNQMWTSTAFRLGLNPILVGHDLHTLYDGTHDINPLPTYIILVTGDESGDIRFYKKTLLDSLRPHTFNETTNEVFFKDSNISLNIHDALEAPKMIFVDPQKLVSYQGNRLCSAYLFWQDSHHELRTLGPDDIVGIGGKSSVLKDVSIACGLALAPTEDSGMTKAQQIFCIKGLGGRFIEPLSRIGYGWKQIAYRPRRLSYIKEE